MQQLQRQMAEAHTRFVEQQASAHAQFVAMQQEAQRLLQLRSRCVTQSVEQHQNVTSVGATLIM